MMYIDTSLAAGKKSVIRLIVIPMSKPRRSLRAGCPSRHDYGYERGHEQRVSGGRVQAELRGRQHARQTRQQHSQAEIDHIEHLRVGSQRGDHLRVLDGGTQPQTKRVRLRNNHNADIAITNTAAVKS